MTASTAYSACKAEGAKSLFTDDPDAAWQPLANSYVALVDGVWRVHSGVTTTSADVASGDPSAFCLVTGTASAPVVLTIGSTIAPPDDPGLWSLPEG